MLMGNVKWYKNDRKIHKIVDKETKYEMANESWMCWYGNFA